MRLSEQRMAEKEAAIAEGEARGKKAFRPSEWPLVDNDANTALMAFVQGVGCEYRVWQLSTGMTITTSSPGGPWPHASIDWIEHWGEQPYPQALLLVAAQIAAHSGDGTGSEIRAHFNNTLVEFE